MIVVSLKYITLILRADNHGEGGIMALLSLASSSVVRRPAQFPVSHRRVRRRTILRRRRHYSGYLGIERSGRTGGGDSPPQTLRIAHNVDRADRAFFAATARHRGHRRPIRAGDAHMVQSHWGWPDWSTSLSRHRYWQRLIPSMPLPFASTTAGWRLLHSAP